MAEAVICIAILIIIRQLIVWRLTSFCLWFASPAGLRRWRRAAWSQAMESLGTFTFFYCHWSVISYTFVSIIVVLWCAPYTSVFRFDFFIFGKLILIECISRLTWSSTKRTALRYNSLIDYHQRPLFNSNFHFQKTDDPGGGIHLETGQAAFQRGLESDFEKRGGYHCGPRSHHAVHSRCRPTEGIL